MQQNLDNLRSRMRELKQTSGGLVTQLTRGASEMEDWSLARSLRLSETVEQFQRGFSELAVMLRETAAEDDVSLPDPTEPLGIIELEEHLAHIGAVRQKIRHAEYLRTRAISVLDEIEQIGCADEPNLPPLQECLEQARAVRSTIEASHGINVPDVVDSLLHDQHPLCALRQLVRGGDDLDDAEWSRLHEIISDNFGRILATAVARGRLSVSGTPASDESVNQSPATGQEESLASSPLPDQPHSSAPAHPTAETSQPLITDAEPPPPVETTENPTASAIIASAIADSDGDVADGPLTVPNLHVPIELPGNVKRRKPGLGRRSPQTLGQLSHEASKASGSQRSELLQSVIWRLILENRMVIAAHLAACLETHDDVEADAPPASLIRCLALGQEVRAVDGPVARELTADLDRVAWLKTGAATELQGVSLRILKAAAAFRPALLAPGTGAATVLREQPLEESLSHFYNYGHRIATFSDRGVPLDPGQFKRLRSEADWQQELDSVQAEVESWLHHPPAGAIQYQTATHCFLRSHWSISPSRATRFPEAIRFWQEWQEPLNRLHRLLEIVGDDRTDQLDVVRSETPFLTNFLRESSSGDAPMPPEATDSAAENIRVDQAHTYFQKSLEAINRWRALHESPPQRRQLPIPRNVEDLENEQRAMHLREEILRRQDSVLRELKAFGEQQKSEALAAAVACCCRAIQDIRHLLDADGEWSTAECDPHEKLSAELREVEGVPLNPHGEPTLPTDELEQRLLESLAQSDAELQMSLDHTEGDSPDPASSDKGTRPDRLQKSDSGEASTTTAEAEQERERVAVREGIESIRQMAAEIFASGAMQAGDWEQIDMRLMQLERQLPVATSFDSLHRELGECREIADDNLRRETGRIRSRMTQLNLNDRQDARSQIEAALKNRDLRTATRLMDAVASGEIPG